MIGEENPRPGIGVFQSTFFVSLHSVGRFFSYEIPWLSGPLHCAQFDPELEDFVFAGREDPDTAAQANTKQSSTLKIRFTEEFLPDLVLNQC